MKVLLFLCFIFLDPRRATCPRQWLQHFPEEALRFRHPLCSHLCLSHRGEKNMNLNLMYFYVMSLISDIWFCLLPPGSWPPQEIWCNGSGLWNWRFQPLPQHWHLLILQNCNFLSQISLINRQHIYLHTAYSFTSINHFYGMCCGGFSSLLTSEIVEIVYCTFFVWKMVSLYCFEIKKWDKLPFWPLVHLFILFFLLLIILVFAKHKIMWI